MTPFERFSPWKDAALTLLEPHKITHQEFMELGSPHIGYIKLIHFNDETLVSVYAANGHILLQSVDVETAIHWIHLHNLRPVAIN